MASGRFFLRWTWADGFVENDEVCAGAKHHRWLCLKPAVECSEFEATPKTENIGIFFSRLFGCMVLVLSQITGNFSGNPPHDWVDGGFFSFHRFSMIFLKKSLRGPGSVLSDCSSFPPQDPLYCVTTSGEQQPHGCSGDTVIDSLKI